MQFNINKKRLDYGSIIFSTSERFALGKGVSIENDAVIVRQEVKSSVVSISLGVINLAKSYFNRNSVNMLFFDFYNLEQAISTNFLQIIYDLSINFGSDVFIVGLRKDESREELISRLEFAKKIKEKKGDFIIFLIDPRRELPIEELKGYMDYLDLIGLYCNVPFGGRPFIEKIISANLSIWQHLEKPIFLLGTPRKIIEVNPRAVKFYQPFFSLLSNLFCTHFRYGPSKSKYVQPETNIVYTYRQLVQQYGEDYPLANLCACDICRSNTVKSFFSGKDYKIIKRIRIHETFVASSQIGNIKDLDLNARIGYLSRKIDNQVGPQIAQIGEINKIGVKEGISEKFFKEMLERYLGGEEVKV